MKNYFFRYTFFFLAGLYLLFRLLSLGSLPIFNDEAIYLNWGWKELYQSAGLFYSLYDGKQPFLMWVFGASQGIFGDQLFAGRIVSVLFGLCTLGGIYILSKQYYSKKVAVVASLFYISIPIFSFYDRMALMESAVAACGVWALYLSLRLLGTEKERYAYLLGIVLAVGFFIKSNALLFLVMVSVVLIYSLLHSKKGNKLLKYFVIISGVIFLILLPLFLQPLYWQTLPMNSRYALTFSELFHFPLINLVKNVVGNVEVLSVFFSLPVFILSIAGVWMSCKEGGFKRVLVLFFLGIFILQSILTRSTSQRYIVSYLPLLCLFSSYAVFQLFEKRRPVFVAVIAGCLLYSFALTTFQTLYPADFIMMTKSISKYAETAALEGQNSGYGIKQAVQSVDGLSNGRVIFVSTALNTGNPEDALGVYFHKSNNVKVGYFDKRLFTPEIDQYDCIHSNVPLYFVSRDYQQAEMNRYLEEVSRVKHPYSNYSIGVYTLKKSCIGNTLEIQPLGPIL